MRFVGRVVGVIMISLSAAACTYNTAVPATEAPAAEVSAGKVVTSPVAIEFMSPASDLDVAVHPDGQACSAHNYPLALSGAFRATFDGVNRLAFRDLVSEDDPGAYRVRIQIDTFDPSLRFDPGFWSATAEARAEFVVKVAVTDANDHEVARQIIEGRGSDRVEGDCPAGSQALSKAVEKALRHVADEYADRVINPLTIP